MVLMHEEPPPKMSQLGVLTNQKPNCIMDYIKRSVISRSKEVILLLCSVLVRPNLEFCTKLWSCNHKKGMDLLEGIQRRPTKMIIGMEHILHEEGLGELMLFRLEKKYFIATFQYLKGSFNRHNLLTKHVVEGQEIMVLN